MGRSNNQVRGGRASVEERAVSLAHRMLAGSGQASVVAYRLDEQPVLNSVAHGFTRGGELVVAAVVDPAEVGEELGVTGEPLEVRVDITKVAPEPNVRIVAASAHLLASLEWLHPLDAELLAGTGELPEIVAAVAAAPNGRLGVLDVARVVLHDGAGVTPLTFGQLLDHRHGAVGDPAEAVVNTEAAGLDVVTGVDRTDLAVMCDAAEQGWMTAHMLTQKPSLSGCAHTTNKDFVVDVDLTGVTVLRHAAQLTSVYFIPFEQGRTSPAELTNNIRTLLGAHAAA